MSSTSGSPGEGVRALAERHGVRPSKALGQHFLTDPNLARAIARDAGVGPGTRVVEVGAGLGSLTTALAGARAAEVLAIEFDAGMIPALEELALTRPSIRVLHADATKLDWPRTLGRGPWILCANLPYNVGTSIVLDVLETAPAVERLVVMVQREVGERLAARAGEKAYGAVSVRVAYRARAELVRKVPPTVFWPRPSVGSVIVRLTRLAAPPVGVDEERLWRVVEEAFAQRRKTMRNALRRLGLDAAEADRVLGATGVDPDARPEQLDLAAFARVAETLPA
ncbi:MAG: 16S rRNA (adenine(1518)-N(6)/adenine(1519)-N(6))-dimethyltransferase RsmA [Actinomycetota bacterium]